MENIAKDVAHGLEKAGKAVATGVEDAGKAVAKVIGIAEKAEKVIVTVVKDEGAMKDTLKTVGKDAVTLSAKVAQCLGERGLSLADDLELLKEVEQFFVNDIEKLLVPAIESAYGEIKVDLAE